MDIVSYLTDRPQMELGGAVLLYGGLGETIATFHPVIGDGGQEGRDVFLGDDPPRPVIGEGRLMSIEGLGAISSILAGNSRNGDLRRQVLPPNVLCAEFGMVAWWIPSHRQGIFFETGTDLDKDVPVSKPVLHPALVFVGKPERLSVYALAEDSRPGPDTEMMRAPYFNIFEPGSMCGGSVPMPKMANVDQIAAYEAAFFNSSFVHTNTKDKELTGHPGGHNGLWREMVSPKIKKFPVNYLKPAASDGHPLTLEMAINR